MSRRDAEVIMTVRSQQQLERGSRSERPLPLIQLPFTQTFVHRDMDVDRSGSLTILSAVYVGSGAVGA